MSGTLFRPRWDDRAGLGTPLQTSGVGYNIKVTQCIIVLMIEIISAKVQTLTGFLLSLFLLFRRHSACLYPGDSCESYRGSHESVHSERVPGKGSEVKQFLRFHQFPAKAFSRYSLYSPLTLLL